MSDVQTYRVIRERLRNPPNAVPDAGIDLRRKKSETTTIPIAALEETQVVPVLRNPLMDRIADLTRQLDEARAQLAAPPPKPPVSIEGVQIFIATAYGMRLTELRSPRREKCVVRVRHIAIYIVKEMTARSLPAIGRMFGHRDHTTILAAIRKIERMRAEDQAFNAEIENLLAKAAKAFA